MTSGQTHADHVLDMFKGTTFQYTSLYISLHKGDPAATGANEHTWSKYARLKIVSATWSAITGTAGTNRRVEATTLTYSTVGTTVAGQTAIYVGVWHHLTRTTASNFIVGGALTASVVLGAGVVPSFATGAMDIEQD